MHLGVETENLRQSGEIQSAVADCGLCQNHEATVYSGYFLHKESVHLTQLQDTSYRVSLNYKAREKIHLKEMLVALVGAVTSLD